MCPRADRNALPDGRAGTFPPAPPRLPWVTEAASLARPRPLEHTKRPPLETELWVFFFFNLFSLNRTIYYVVSLGFSCTEFFKAR